ncbi:G-type lectin S-receptor-like serine/threonine-protein kinase At4g27290 isoform X2 [Hevea brasiliensis]|uniref:G-type lectin S-receptor-like serine/threonine-protein kinase At4g27290 isoform X2 n=1 Tax=Hevea brasiliensis TaxID=3981 RepID=UPI0025E077AF|nr:G-type lectin S-receptor-like serine/threonine-protein kinase At4g27290 isoform X2 [Hevea brasiliensis]
MQQTEKQKKTMENFIILLVCFSLTSTFITSMALDTIATTQTIRDNETIVSAGGTFELGFFSPGTSNYRYVGVWYKKISYGTIVWVANRDTPLTDSSGVLKLSDKGILVLLNQSNTTIWSSGTSGVVQNPVAQLLDSGNLVIRDENDLIPENFLWQSFDHPDSTYLPGMKLGLVPKGLYVYLSSWKSIDDPSQGNFTFQIDVSSLQIILKQNSVVKARSGPWNGVGFSGIPFLKPNPIYNYKFVFHQKEVYYIYETVDSSVFTMMVLNQDGVMARFTWVNRTSSWSRYLSAPADNCDTYALCGAHGSCNIGNSPVCGCLNGFVPKQKNDWDKADWSGGCVRRTPLDCQKGDGFIKYPNVKLPDMKNSSINEDMTLTLEECEMICLKNCSCMAYANSNISGRGSGCFFWFGELIDIRQYEEEGQDLYIRMASSEIDQGGSNHKRQVIIIASTVSLTGMVLLGMGVSFVAWKMKKKKQKTQGPPGKQENNLEGSYSMKNQKEDLELPHFDFSTIANATNNFSFSNLLGQGGFGPVYKGLLEGGVEIAVKRLSKNSSQGLDEFKNEVKCIAKLQHRNLVKLLGYCIELEEKMLIYEYMPNKSLDLYISDDTQRMSLDWTMRFHIISGISRGLLYLHQDSRLRIIHRDLKPSNILLDNEMNPKISDFGMARSFMGNETEANTKRVVGTYGYMSPEYAIDGLFSVKSDVFSFGVLVLEILSGKRNRGFSHPEHQLNLLGHVRHGYSSNKADIWI